MLDSIKRKQGGANSGIGFKKLKGVYQVGMHFGRAVQNGLNGDVVGAVNHAQQGTALAMDTVMVGKGKGEEQDFGDDQMVEVSDRDIEGDVQGTNVVGQDQGDVSRAMNVEKGEFFRYHRKVNPLAMVRKRKYSKKSAYNRYRHRRRKGTAHLKPERKYYDAAAQIASANNEFDSGSLVCLNAIIQGNGDSERIGRKMQMTSFQVNLHFKEGTDSCIQRVMIILVPDNGGTQVDVDQILHITVQERAVISPWKMSGLLKYRVLFDKIYPVSPGDSADEMILQIRQKLNKITTYNGAGATYASVANNALWMYTFTSSNLAGVAPIINYASRVRYFDG